MSGKLIEYRGYYANLEVDVNAKLIGGRVLGLQAILTFQGETVDEATQSFHDAVETYLDDCIEEGEEPEKPFSGSVFFRTKPELHRRMALAADAAGCSLSKWINETIEARLSSNSEGMSLPAASHLRQASTQGEAHFTPHTMGTVESIQIESSPGGAMTFDAWKLGIRQENRSVGLLAGRSDPTAGR